MGVWEMLMGLTLFPVFKKATLQLKCLSCNYMQTQFIHPLNGVCIPLLCIAHMTLNLFILLLPAIYQSQSEACVKSIM